MPGLERKRAGKRHRRGQAVTEYSAVMVMAVLIMIIMMLLLAVFSEYGWRVLSLIGDFPYSG